MSGDSLTTSKRNDGWNNSHASGESPERVQRKELLEPNLVSGVTTIEVGGLLKKAVILELAFRVGRLFYCSIVGHVCWTNPETGS
jgi:hypothetical protein